MKLAHIISLTLASMMTPITANAIMAYPYPVQVNQPDGTVVTVQLHGDEFLNFATTLDGYTIIRNSLGAYAYAEQGDDGPVVTDILAHDAEQRTPSEQAFLTGQERYLMPQPTVSQSTMRKDRASARFEAPSHRAYNYKQFKGLVILVQFKDCKFTMSNPQPLFDAMINQHDYTGYYTEGDNPEKVECTGSVRDYFYDNSLGLFDPSFDVVGPVTIDYSMYYAQKTTYARTLVKAACEAVDEDVDFSKYDCDGDGTVDMFYLIFAGPGSHFGTNDTRLLWPHAWNMVSTKFDGVSLDRYACSTELYGAASDKQLDGIGTVCHEFSHVLGLKDEYDTDYSSSGGTSAHPGDWSLMASGSYLNYSRTPTGYSLFQRYQSGFVVPPILNAEGTYTLQDLDKTNQGYMLRTAEPNEYFLLENRRCGDESKWNKYVPGHGMLVFRVDSTDTKVWTNNQINVNPAHNYLEILRAAPKTEDSQIVGSDGDPFPGSGNVTTLNTQTTPSLMSWSGLPPMISISEITESEDGVITFKAVKDPTEVLIEDFENITTETANDSNVKGVYCDWTFTKAQVAEPTEEGMCNGAKALSMVRGSIAESSVIPGKTQSITLRVTNSGSTSATLNILYYDNETAQWNTIVTSTGSAIAVTRNATVTSTIDVPEEVASNLKFQVKVIAGSSTSNVWVDDIQIIRTQESTSGIEDITAEGDAQASGVSVTVTGGVVNIKGEGDGEVALYNIVGKCVAVTHLVDGQGQLTLPSHGYYILKTPARAIKIAY
jgi:M6 family metalloprotease-like protein